MSANPARLAGARSGSLAQKVCAYLEANPEEELTRSDIAAKFGCAVAAVDSALAPVVLAGRLARDKNEDDGIVWRFPDPGRRSAFAASEHASRQQAKARRRAAMAVDLSTIQIRRGVPLFEQPKREEGWNNLFSQMTEPLDSFEIPIQAHAALAHAAAAFRKNHQPSWKFSIRKVSETHCGIWRLA